MVLGPMVGPKLFPAQGEAKAREERLYKEWGLTELRRSTLAKAWRGDRRPMLLRPRHLQVTHKEYSEGKLGLSLTFCLPSGSFATAILGALIEPQKTGFKRQLSG